MIEVNNKKCEKMKYKVGDKFVIEVKEAIESEKGTLYRADFSTLVFDDYGLDKLPKYCEVPTKDEFIEPKCTFEKEVDEAYNKGLNDAWELARKLYDMKCDELGKIFGIWDSFYEIIRNCAPQEALAKLKAYEEEQSKIEVGDVVKDTEGWEYVVTNIYKDRDSCRYNGVTSCGKWTGCCEPTKTGKHIDISSILEQIGE